jgi:hypothetical protein
MLTFLVALGTRLSKNSKHVSFPIVLDLAPFCVAKYAIRFPLPPLFASMATWVRLL